MNLTHDDVQNILKIIDEAEHLEEIELAYGDFRLHVRRHGAAPDAGAAAEVPAPGAISTRPASAPVRVAAPIAAPAEQIVPEGMVAIRAPMLGTFYRAPAPGEKPFVEAGQRVKSSDTVCLIEVMKLFNSITAGVDGRIAGILAENAALVEYRQILILIELDKS